MGTATPARSLNDLSERDRVRLREASRRLRSAVNNYEGFLGTELEPGTEPRAHATAEVAATQKAIEDAERAYWALRAELLGQVGPTWTPGASQVSDWFSDEDTVYDGLTEEDDP